MTPWPCASTNRTPAVSCRPARFSATRRLSRLPNISVRRLQFGVVLRPGLEPLHVIVHGIAVGRSRRVGLEQLLGGVQSPTDARVDIVPILKVDVFEQVAADRIGWNRIAIHLDSSQARDRPFDGISRSRRYSSMRIPAKDVPMAIMTGARRYCFKI